MLTFVKAIFRQFIDFFLWLNFVVSILGGGVLGYFLGLSTSGSDPNIAFILIGAIVGFLWGVITNVLWGGYISTILNMDTNIELLVNMNKQKNNLDNASSIEKRICRKCGKSFDIDYSACPHCGSALFEIEQDAAH